MSTDIHAKIRLAKAFGEQIQAALSRAEFRDMIDRNKAEDDVGVCHSHDFCDANMHMLEAFKEVFSREPAFLQNPDETADLEVWNDAWAIAVAADFFA